MEERQRHWHLVRKSADIRQLSERPSARSSNMRQPPFLFSDHFAVSPFPCLFDVFCPVLLFAMSLPDIYIYIYLSGTGHSKCAHFIFLPCLSGKLPARALLEI